MTGDVGVLASLGVLPEQWTRPIVGQMVLSAHAGTSKSVTSYLFLLICLTSVYKAIVKSSARILMDQAKKDNRLTILFCYTFHE